MQIQETNRLEIFNPIKGNRSLNKLHLRRLKKSIKDKNLLKYQPILVDGEYNVIDGQHRLEIAKELEIPIYYIKEDSLDIEDVRILNQNSKDWKGEDFLEGYCDLKMENYIYFRDYMKRYTIGFGHALRILSGRESGNTFQEFKEGKFIASHKELGEILGVSANQFITLFDFSKQRSFIGALGLAYKRGADLDILFKKCAKDRGQLYKCVDAKNYLVLLEKIYNKHSREKINLRF